MSTGTGAMHRVMLAIGSLPWVRVFRNNVGLGLAIRHGNSAARQAIIRRCIAVAESMGGSATPIQFGLVKGSSDLVGWTSRVITAADVGKRVAIFTAIEAKDGAGRADTDQRRFIDNVQAAGGIAGVARTADEALALVNGEGG